MMEEALLNNLASNGILGVILAWFMLRIEKLLQRNNEVLASFVEATRKCTGGKR